MLNLKHIEAFVTVADLGTFRRAAEHLNTTQPNISTRIAQLEAQLGVVLMERDAGSVRLTPKGVEMLVAARKVIEQVDRLISAAGDSALFEGVLKLGVSELVAHTWLRAFLLQMKDDFPNIAVELTVDLSANLSEALFAREIDLAFQSGPFDRRAKGSLPLGGSDYVWVAAAGFQGENQRMTAREIAKHRILTHARKTVPHRQFHEHFQALGLSAQLVPASNIGSCLQMTLDGLGISCLPRAMTDKLVSGGQLVELKYAWTPDPLRFAARHELDPVPTYVIQAMQIAQGLSPPGLEDKKMIS